jgi:signal transduction histidine kinase
METSGYKPHLSNGLSNGAPIAATQTPAVYAAVLAANDALRRQIPTLEQRIERLLVADDSTDRFLAMVSHELRTPLAAILPWAHALSTGAPRAEFYRGVKLRVPGSPRLAKTPR